MNKASTKHSLLPVNKEELPFFLLMSGLLIGLSLNHAIIHDVKDTLIVGHVGPTFIAYLKFWVILPGAVSFFLIYSKLSTILPQKTLFRSILFFYGAFFLLYAFFLYPNFHPHHPDHPNQGFDGLKGIQEHWDLVLFYLLGELWGNIVLGLLFWGFTSRLVKLTVAQRFYVPLNLSSALATIIGGGINGLVSSFIGSQGYAYQQTLQILSIILAFNVITAIFLHRKIIHSLPNNKSLLQKFDHQTNNPTKKSFFAAMKTVFGSSYLARIAFMVICFGLSYNFIEIIWKFQIKQIYPNLNDYGAFIGKVTIAQGLFSMIVIIFGAGIVTKFGWKTSALITPIVLLISALLFFLSVFVDDYKLITNVSWIAKIPIFLGAFHFIAVRTCRLTFFEPSKEMLFIPLSKALKTQGKAAVDVMSDRLGKGGGSLLQHILISSTGSVIGFAPYACALILLVFSAWFASVNSLSKSFELQKGSD